MRHFYNDKYQKSKKQNNLNKISSSNNNNNVSTEIIIDTPIINKNITISPIQNNNLLIHDLQFPRNNNNNNNNNNIYSSSNNNNNQSKLNNKNNNTTDMYKGRKDMERREDSHKEEMGRGMEGIADNDNDEDEDTFERIVIPKSNTTNNTTLNNNTTNVMNTNNKNMINIENNENKLENISICVYYMELIYSKLQILNYPLLSNSNSNNDDDNNINLKFIKFSNMTYLKGIFHLIFICDLSLLGNLYIYIYI
jgi:hypothetical protein